MSTPGVESRDEALRAVEAAADVQWVRVAKRIMVRLVRSGERFSSNDLWAAGLPDPREPRALGPLFMTLSRRRVIRKTGNMLQSTRGRQNARPVTEWVAA